MLVLTNSYLKQTNTSCKSSQLRRLERNQKDIAQLIAKLCCYISEPRTYEQFRQLTDLKDRAKELRQANANIVGSLHNELNTMERCSRLLEKHLQNFELFSKEVLDYTGATKVSHTAHF
jgi:hypothetical protein